MMSYDVHAIQRRQERERERGEGLGLYIRGAQDADRKSSIIIIIISTPIHPSIASNPILFRYKNCSLIHFRFSSAT